jgi:hypothetical protein
MIGSVASNRHIVNPYSIIAFFGFETDSAKAFYERCLAWFDEHGIAPSLRTGHPVWNTALWPPWNAVVCRGDHILRAMPILSACVTTTNAHASGFS